MFDNKASKSNLAKLLATENINVVYRKTDTASFNVAERTLVLPVWNDMTEDMTDLLIGHEVGHAIDTPTEYGDTELQAYGKGFKTFLNVIEDARIERRIKDRYPGLKRSFSKGYQEFIARDFFQVKGKDLGKMLLIDRLNLHYKIGPFFPVEITSEEQVFVKKIDAVSTFDDVIAVAKEVYEYCKQELEDKRQQAMEEFQAKVDAGEFDDMDMDFDEGESDFSNPFDDGQDLNPNGYGDSDDEDSDEDGMQSIGEGYSHEANTKTPKYKDPQELAQYDEVKAATDENLQNALKQMTEKKEIKNGFSTTDKEWHYDTLIVDYKKIVGNIFDSKEGYKDNILIEFENKTKNSVSYLVKEFEMRKQAAELRRIVISDTGVLDTNKLHTYKFNDDIFRKTGSVSAGKNHGVVMFIDWSGSMTDNMKGTIEQLVTLTTFCRKVSIPFDVYAFSTEWYDTNPYVTQRPICTPGLNTIGSDSKFRLLNLLSSRMRNQEYRRMATDLLNYAEIVGQYWKRNQIQDRMHLGGTPLNSTILCASGVVNRFRKAYRTEIVDVVFLTDGEDSSTMYTNSKDYYGTVGIGPSTRYSISYLEDKETHKRYRVEGKGITPVLLQMLKDRTGCNLLGFYILPKQKRYFEGAMARMEMINLNWAESFSKFKSEKYFAIEKYGYDQYFLIPGGKELNVEDEDLDDLLGENNTQVSARKLKGAFLKMNQSRLTNRVLLSKIIDVMA